MYLVRNMKFHSYSILTASSGCVTFVVISGKDIPNYAKFFHKLKLVVKSLNSGRNAFKVAADFLNATMRPDSWNFSNPTQIVSQLQLLLGAILNFMQMYYT